MNVEVLQTTKIGRRKDFLTFFLTALFGASVNFFSQIVYRENLDYTFDTSVVLGYLTATVVSFVPTKVYAFSARQTGNTSREAVKFVAIALVAWAVQYFVSVGTLRWIATPLLPKVEIFWREKTSHVAGMGFSFLANYFGHKLLTFRSTGVYDRLRARTGRVS
ncbi:GtrA family protein [Rudanella paleaurantiibacter]|uniref:GtrA family protein n=1 Tax=Rudanella paleaurantiibacter TaxID=2614655 RepID=A0A7J5TXH2_9BACT|nr:GtrA family protein [Rudanella paleaurantiibacter]KAB7729123.1 GtrA family protein [Rudanella paleaurantiibacter]